MGYIKFMQAFDKKLLREVEKEAKRRGISKQEVIRAVMVPDWLQHYKREKKILDILKVSKLTKAKVKQENGSSPFIPRT